MGRARPSSERSRPSRSISRTACRSWAVRRRWRRSPRDSSCTRASRTSRSISSSSRRSVRRSNTSSGSVRFVVFYLLCGVLGALAQTSVDPGSQVAEIGASGAIAGVLGAYILRFPHAPSFLRIPAFVVIGLWAAVAILCTASERCPRTYSRNEAAGPPISRISAGFSRACSRARCIARAPRHRAKLGIATIIGET